MKKHELVEYGKLLSDIKLRVRQGQQRAALSANATMILTYWDIGQMIARRQEAEGWGASVIPRLAVDLKNELPEEKGFSPRNLGNMVRFFREYGVPTILQHTAAKLGLPGIGTEIEDTEAGSNLQRTAAKSNTEMLHVLHQAILQLPWYHNVILMQKCKDVPVRLWYAEQTLEHGWSRDTLTANIKSSAHTRQGAAVSNFGKRLPAVHAELASGLLKDPYMFDFFTMEEHFHERELETGLLTHIEKFLLELGRGFAFVGRQYSLRDIEKPIGVADYELTRALPENLASSLPSIEAIEAELSQDLSEDES